MSNAPEDAEKENVKKSKPEDITEKSSQPIARLFKDYVQLVKVAFEAVRREQR